MTIYDLWFITFYWAGFYSCPEGKGTRGLQGPIQRCPTSPTLPFAYEYEKTATAPGSPYSFRIVRGFFYVPQNYQHSRNCETGPPTYRTYPRRLESLTIWRYITKAALSPQLFKDPECWSGRNLELTTSRVTARCTTKWATKYGYPSPPKFKLVVVKSKPSVQAFYLAI